MDLSKYKKIFLGIGFLAAVFIIGYLIFIFFFQTAPAPEKPTEKEKERATTSQGLPTAETGPGQVVEPGKEKKVPSEPKEERKPGDKKAQGRITETTTLNDSPSISPTLGSDQKSIQYYDQNNGKFYRINEQGETESLSDKTFHNVESVNWSPHKNKAVIEYPDGSNIIYNFQTEEQITLPKHWEDFNFSPTGRQIAFKSMGMSPENRWLAISNDKGSKTRVIEEIGTNADKVHTSWSPNNQIIGMHTEGESFDRQKVYFIGKNEENFQSMTIPGRGFEHKWSEKGDKMLYSVYSENSDLKPELWTVNTDINNIGSGRKRLEINTWADKCTFSNNSEVYCGVPENLKTGSGMFREKDTDDSLYKLNLDTGSKELIAIPDKEYSMANLQVSEDEETLYFTDKKNGEIHKIDLK